MNRLLFTLFAMFLMAVSTSAQTFEGGITAGLVASQVSGDQSAGYNKLGIYGGPYASFQIRERMRFQMEITYIQKGSTQNPHEDNGYYSYRSKLNYVEVPLMLRYLYTDAFDFELGIAYSVLISSYEELYDVELNERPFNTHNSSLIAGVYYRFNDRWSANFRTSNSITPIRKHKSGQTYRLNFGQTNNLLSLGLFFTI
jgi:hypothetical protein